MFGVGLFGLGLVLRRTMRVPCLGPRLATRSSEAFFASRSFVLTLFSFIFGVDMAFKGRHRRGFVLLQLALEGNSDKYTYRIHTIRGSEFMLLCDVRAVGLPGSNGLG